MPFDLSDLIQPAGEALTQAKSLVTQLGPIMNRLDRLSSNLETSLPPLITHADQFLQSGNSVLANFNTPEGKKRLNEMLDSLRVSTENLKVVSTNAKALTADACRETVARFLGRPDRPASHRGRHPSSRTMVLHLKQDVDVRQ